MNKIDEAMHRIVKHSMGEFDYGNDGKTVPCNLNEVSGKLEPDPTLMSDIATLANAYIAKHYKDNTDRRSIKKQFERWKK